MNGFPDLQVPTKILADPSRQTMLTILMDGKFHTVTELAKKAKIKSHTASYHLKQLCELNWVTSYKQGRNVYYCLCSEDVADLLEKLMNISPIKEIRSFNESHQYQKLQKGRSCYKHLAGKLGVDFFNYLIHNNYVLLEHHSLTLTSAGSQYFEAIGINMDRIKKQPGTLVKPCLDWTERTFHLGGNLGRAFFALCEKKQFIYTNKEDRSVGLIQAGEQFFASFVS